MDEELKVIKKIYGVFNDHPLPIKATGSIGGKRLSS